MVWVSVAVLVVLALCVVGWIYFFGAEEEVVEEIGYSSVGVDEAVRLIESGAVIVDVSENYSLGRIPDAIWYNYYDGTLGWSVSFLNADNTYLIYSRDEESSRSAVNRLVGAGFVNVYRLDGGFRAWELAELEVEF